MLSKLINQWRSLETYEQRVKSNEALTAENHQLINPTE